MPAFLEFLFGEPGVGINDSIFLKKVQLEIHKEILRWLFHSSVCPDLLLLSNKVIQNKLLHC